MLKKKEKVFILKNHFGKPWSRVDFLSVFVSVFVLSPPHFISLYLERKTWLNLASAQLSKILLLCAKYAMCFENKGNKINIVNPE